MLYFFYSSGRSEIEGREINNNTMQHERLVLCGVCDKVCPVVVVVVVVVRCKIQR